MFAKRMSCLTFFLLLTCVLTSCSKKPKGSEIKKIPVVSVTGVVTIDGKPEEGIRFFCVPTGEFPVPERLPWMQGTASGEGEFSIRMYDDVVGIPPGEYVLTFIWPTESLKRRSNKEELFDDQLKGKYASKANPALKFTVESDTPLELPPIDLKTK